MRWCHLFSFLFFIIIFTIEQTIYYNSFIQVTKFSMKKETLVICVF